MSAAARRARAGRAARLLACGGAAAAACARPAPPPFAGAGQALEPTGAVRIFATAGSVTVEGWDRDSVHVSGRVDGSTPRWGGARTYFKLSTYDGHADASGRSELVVRAPRRAQLWIKATTARVRVRDVAGSVDLYTIDGPIEAAGAPAELTAESMRGAVHVSGTPRWLRAKSGTGPVTFAGEAGDVALTSVSGRIVSSSRFGRGRFESVRGDVEIVGPLAGAATAEVDDYAGAVTLRLEGAPSARFTVYSVAGRVTNALSGARAAASRGTGRELAFALGAGEARVTIRTFDGPVTLTAAPRR